MDQMFYRGLLDALTDGVYFVDLHRRVTYWNKAAERISGYAAAEVMGKSCADDILKHVDEDCRHLCVEGCPLAETMKHGTIQEISVFLHHKYGHRVPVFVRASPMRDKAGKIIGAVEVFSENSETLSLLKEMEILRKEVLTDKLTEVGNRRYAGIIMEKLENSFDQDKVVYGVLFVDIDHFKRVNDTWGHHVGDKVLRMVAQSLSSTLRPLDAVCRWGGEEFVILVSNTDADGLAAQAERLRTLVEQSWVDHEGEQIRVTVSFGGALVREGEDSVAVTVRADRQLYLSKDAGRNCIYIEGVKTSSGKGEPD